MPIVAIIVGAIMLDLAFRGTEHEFAKQLGQDFGQSSQFYAWGGAIVVIGALGYVPAIGRLANLLLALVILVAVIKNGGAFNQVEQLIQSPPAPAPAVSITSYSGSSSSGGSSGSSGSSGSGGLTTGLLENALTSGLV